MALSRYNNNPLMWKDSTLEELVTPIVVVDNFNAYAEFPDPRAEGYATYPGCFVEANDRNKVLWVNTTNPLPA